MAWRVAVDGARQLLIGGLAALSMFGIGGMIGHSVG